jgi:hypothetical protein
MLTGQREGSIGTARRRHDLRSKNPKALTTADLVRWHEPGMGEERGSMATAKKPDRSDDVIEHEGMLWRPKRGALSSADEFLAARALFIETYQDSIWNPWVLDDWAEDLNRAQQIMEEWKRAEPGHRTMTKKQWDAKMAREDREFKARQADDEKRHEHDRERYDPEREHARLSLLERQSRLEYELREISGLRDGTSTVAANS